MDKELVRAYLWQAIIRLGFSPSSRKDQLKWLRLYARSLQDFWELDTPVRHPKMNNNVLKLELDCARMFNLYLEYTEASSMRWSIQIYYLSASAFEELIFTHEVDKGFFIVPIQKFLPSREEKIAFSQFDTKDLEAVIDGLICHPAVHLHIKQPINEHRIRLGGGIDNPYHYLFQIRFQLCPDQAKQQAERIRLMELFYHKLKHDRFSHVAANDLLASLKIGMKNFAQGSSPESYQEIK